MNGYVRRCGFGIIAVLGMAAGLWLAPGRAGAAWTEGQPIVTYWNPANSTTTLTNAIADASVAGGYNLVWVTYRGNLSALASQLAIAQSHGLRAQIYDSQSVISPSSLDGGTKQATLDALIDQAKASPAMYSYLIKDEPTAADFSGWATLVNYIRQRDPNHLGYINLMPTYASNAELGTTSYSGYLSQYVSTVQPSLISYDHYQLMATSDTSQYLQNLGLVSAAAKQAGVPFMNVVQACAWDTTWRLPNANELRFLVYSTAAYGAQGISYFNYWRQTGATGGLQPNSDGTPTSVYTALTPLNKEFTNIVRQLQSMRSIGQYLEGYSTTTTWSWSQWKYITTYNGPPGTTTLPSNSPFNISSVSNSLSYNDGDPLKGVLFGLFDTDGTAVTDATVAMVENLDYTSSETYTVTGPGNLSVFNADTGLWTATGHNFATVNLDPGGGVLVGLTSMVPEPSTITLLATGLTALLAYAWRKRR